MKSHTIVFIAQSLDGYIADKNGGLDWLQSIPNPENIDMGYEELINRIDAIIMGRKTFETVLSFGIEWPYPKPVYVLSNTLNSAPQVLNGKVEIINGDLKENLKKLSAKNHSTLYLDGGTTITSFLKEDLVDELIITTIPVLLGGGSPLFSELPELMKFDHKETKVYLDQIVQSKYLRNSEK